jgi:hypothetical protein
VFLSYSHEDRDLAAQVARALEGVGLHPLWDKHIRPGTPFTEAIQRLIIHAHIFMPILTEHARQRPWVHQETGYAMALNVPVLPLAIGNLPGEMMAQLQAMQVQQDLSDLAEQLNAAQLDSIVMNSARTPVPIPIEVADDTEDAYRLGIQYATRVGDDLGFSGRVRQVARVSLFCIPDAPENDPAWAIHDGTMQRGPYVHKLARERRRIMERHARAAGCSLIIDPVSAWSEINAAAQRSRLTQLLTFLESMPDEQVCVACSPHTSGDKLLTLLGDWFSSESPVRQAGQGWRHSVFTWHAPTVLRRMKEFDDRLNSLLARKGVKPQDSKRIAVEEIRNAIKSLS